MVAKFASLRTKPTLKSLFKGILFTLLVLFLYEYQVGFWTAFIFVSGAVVLYSSPRLNSFKYAVSFLAITLAPFVLPPLPVGPVVEATILGFVFMALLGVKNLVFLRRDRWYLLIHVSILFIYGSALFYNPPSFFNESAAFILFLLLFREFYRTMTTLQGGRLALSFALQSLVAIELIQVLYLLPIGFISEAALFVLILTAFSDIFLHHLNGKLSRRLILRDATALALLSLIVMSLSGWSLAG